MKSREQLASYSINHEKIIRELKILANKKPLNPISLENAKQLMRQLKAMGFTNQEISKLTDGGWKESTLKSYTRGVDVEDRSYKNRALDLLQELVYRGLTLDDVEDYLSLRKDFKAEGVNFEELPNLLRKLEEFGISFDGLKTIVESAARYGRYDVVLEAIEVYGNLKKLNKEVKKTENEESRLNQEIDKKRTSLENLEEQRKKGKRDLELYHNLKSSGFNIEILEKLKEASEVFVDFEELLNAINTYKSMIELKKKLSNLEEKKKKIEAEVRNLESKYAYLESVSRLCEELMYKYGFGIQSIENLYKTAKKHGNPFEVLKTISEYNQREDLKNEVEKLRTKKRTLEVECRELKSQVQELKTTAQQLKTHLERMLTLSSTKITEGIAQLEDTYVKSISEITSELTSTINRSERIHTKTLNENSAILRSTVDNIKNTSVNLENVYDTALQQITAGSIEVGKLLERMDTIEKNLKSQVMPLLDLVTKPTETKDSPEKVFQSMLAYISALISYIQVNKNEIDNDYSITTILVTLRDELIGRLKNA